MQSGRRSEWSRPEAFGRLDQQMAGTLAAPPEQTCPERQEREHLGVKSLRCHPRDKVFLGGVPPVCARHARRKPPAFKLFARYSDLMDL